MSKRLSPPRLELYFGLRDYGTAQWEGGDPGCDHTGNYRTADSPGRAKSTLGGGRGTNAENERSGAVFRDTCGKCGARRVDSQFGLEPTIGEYVARLVELFRELRRALRDDGVVFLNLGDSYAGGGGFSPTAPSAVNTRSGQRGASVYGVGMGIKPQGNLKPKDLCMIPARVAIALQDDGWWLRQEIVWHKRAPMPESCTDRCTRAHEMVYMLSKRATYYYDAEAVREEANPESIARYSSPFHVGTKEVNGAGRPGAAANTPGMKVFTGYRNRRSVWTLGPESYKGSHFAVMPTKLVEPCIKAGTSAAGCCPVCGAPWARVVEVTGERATHGVNHVADDARAHEPIRTNGTRHGNTSVLSTGKVAVYETTGWRPTCDHDAEPVPCVVLDPFMGSGTVAAVAVGLGRHYVGFELNPEYVRLAHARLCGVNMPLLAGAL